MGYVLLHWWRLEQAARARLDFSGMFLEEGLVEEFECHDHAVSAALKWDVLRGELSAQELGHLVWKISRQDRVFDVVLFHPRKWLKDCAFGNETWELVLVLVLAYVHT